MDRELLTDVHDNWAGWLAATADHVATGQQRRFGPITAASTGIPMPLFNQAFVFEEPDPQDLADAVAWLSERGVPFWVTVPDELSEELIPAAGALGLARRDRGMPGMALLSLDDISPRATFEVDLHPATTAEDLEHLAAVASEGFEAPIEAARLLIPASTLDDDRMRWFVGSLEGEVVACGQLFPTGRIAGVYTIAVREAFRRRGIGEAMTWEVLRAGRDLGCDVGALQASPLGRPVYRRMGFDDVVRYRMFVPAG